MSPLDYLVLVGTLLGIAGYGVWRTRKDRGLENYLRGDQTIRWGTIGLSVMATQASAITFLSTPGQAYASGMAFVQNYFGLPFAIIIICAFFIPLYQRLHVYTAYEFLGRRFDAKTRYLGAFLFLVQRGLAAGITIYAPAIILSTILGWSLDLTVLATGIVVVVYTVSGGTKAVSLTQRYQMAVIFLGMAIAFSLILRGLPAEVSLFDAASIAGAMGKMEVVDFSLDPNKRYTFWSGMLGGLFLSLSYFGTDQSQVQRYLAGTSANGPRLGLLFNAVVKIPMQFFILFLGVLLFVFYQFEQPPVFFNQPAWERAVAGEQGEALRDLETAFASNFAAKEAALLEYAGSTGPAQEGLRSSIVALDEEARGIREAVRRTLLAGDPEFDVKDSDYVFITFILHHLPNGIIGLLLAVILAAAMSSTASELNALGSTTMVDFYKPLTRSGKPHSETHDVGASRFFTALWGCVAIGFALFASLVENLIEAVNILGSIFYGVILGIFLVAFFIRHVRGTAVFVAGVIGQCCVIVLHQTLDFGYLWLNPIGCGLVVVLAILLQATLGGGPEGENAGTPGGGPGKGVVS